jgi:glycopeptide antibiotics resistance protein
MPLKQNHDSLRVLCRYGFYVSVLLLLYGTLFPFRFDFSSQHLARAWENTNLVPYWDVDRGRIHGLPDTVSNILLTIPLGFFGFLWLGRSKRAQGCARWFALGFSLGLCAEIIQLVIPSRVSGITDALNNGLGAFLGAWAASLFGPAILNLLSGSLFDKKHTSFLVLMAIIAATMLLPFNFGMDVSQIKGSIKQLLRNPWELGKPIEDEWIQMVEFALIGALAGSIGKRRMIALTILLPFVLEPLQILVEFHSPSCRDVLMNFAGVAGGLFIARYIPSLINHITGFVFLSLALIAQGLSPYQFVGWSARAHFEWIPLVEYYYQTTGAALYDAMSGLLSYALLVALWPRRITLLWAVLLASSIEAVQLIIPARFAGTTDILIAFCGACAGYALSRVAGARWALDAHQTIRNDAKHRI